MSKSSFHSQSPTRQDEVLTDILLAVCPRGISVGCRTIESGDEHFLLPQERQSVRTSNIDRLRASGAARHIAHRLLGEYDKQEFPILRASSGDPIWPKRIVGSLAHDDEVAVAAVGNADSFSGLGIDVEPSVPLPEDIQSLVRNAADDTGEEHASGISDRILFCAKEAVYKAVYPLDRVMLNFDDISINLTENYAITTTGRQVQLVFCSSPRIIVLAFLPNV